jgi:putative membrane protein
MVVFPVKGGRQVFKLVVALICALLVALFAVQNHQGVAVRFLTGGLEISLALIIIGSAAVGAIFAFVLGIFRQFSQGRRIKEYKQRVAKLEEELESFQGACEDSTSREGDRAGVASGKDMTKEIGKPLPSSEGNSEG